MFEYRAASQDDLRLRWEKNIADNPGDSRWPIWRDRAIAENLAGSCRTYVVVKDGFPIGEGTLLLTPSDDPSEDQGKPDLVGEHITNVNALRIDKEYEGQGHISRLVKLMEREAAALGYNTITIGVEADQPRNIAIYLHWGYNSFVRCDIDFKTQIPVLYYEKDI